MADLNDLRDKILGKSSEIENTMKSLYNDYEIMYREGFKELSASRNASGGSMEGLEEFYLVVQTARRNRDVVTSLLKGLKSLRPIDKFQFIEEEVPKIATKHKPKETKTTTNLDLHEIVLEEPKQTEVK